MQRAPEHRPSPTALLTWPAPLLDAESSYSDSDSRLPEAGRRDGRAVRAAVPPGGTAHSPGARSRRPSPRRPTTTSAS
ncbi:hypothetical protein ACU686_01065 [Yinghuangia aomiensis]